MQTAMARNRQLVRPGRALRLAGWGVARCRMTVYSTGIRVALERVAAGRVEMRGSRCMMIWQRRTCKQQRMTVYSTEGRVALGRVQAGRVTTRDIRRCQMALQRGTRKQQGVQKVLQQRPRENPEGGVRRASEL